MKCHCWYIGIFVVLMVVSVKAQCDKCGLSGVACTSLINFQPCFASNQISTASTGGSCPSGTYCNANSSSICVGPASLLVPSCIPESLTNRCGECSATGRFACLNATAFGFCFGANTVSRDTVFSCPIGQYCNVDEDEPGFCTTNTTKITCMTDTIISTQKYSTIAPSISTTNATTWCSTRKSTGRFAQPLDLTCRTYFYCMIYNYRYHGVSFECVGQTYFNDTIGKCVSSEGISCSNGTLIAKNSFYRNFLAQSRN